MFVKTFNMNREQRKEISDFKDKWAQKKGYENWYDYKDWCDSNGFDEDEIRYDELMFEYGQHLLLKWSEEISLNGILDQLQSLLRSLKGPNPND